MVRVMNDRHPALAAFLYVLSCFVLLAQVVGCVALGGYIAGGYGALGGLIVGVFVFVWIGCWYVSVA